jgi:hypothetical protein
VIPEGAADETVLKKELRKIPKNPLFLKNVKTQPKRMPAPSVGRE